jgi:hypothetical protein
LALWLITLALPAQTTICDDRIYTSRGWVMLLCGWLAPLTIDESLQSIEHAMSLGLRRFAWFANPIWLFGVCRMWRGRRPSLFWSLVATALAASGLQNDFEYMGDEHGRCGPITAQMGAWLWVLAISIPLYASIPRRGHASLTAIG